MIRPAIPTTYGPVPELELDAWASGAVDAAAALGVGVGKVTPAAARSVDSFW
jgi:hypothetical protein